MTAQVTKEDFNELKASITQGNEEIKLLITNLISGIKPHPATTVKLRKAINTRFKEYCAGMNTSSYKDNKGPLLFQHMTTGPDEEWKATGKPSLWPFEPLGKRIEKIKNEDPKIAASWLRGGNEDIIKTKANNIWTKIFNEEPEMKKWATAYIDSIYIDQDTNTKEKERKSTSSSSTSKKKTSKKELNQQPTKGKKAKKVISDSEKSSSEESSSDEP